MGRADGLVVPVLGLAVLDAVNGDAGADAGAESGDTTVQAGADAHTPDNQRPELNGLPRSLIDELIAAGDAAINQIGLKGVPDQAGALFDAINAGDLAGLTDQAGAPLDTAIPGDGTALGGIAGPARSLLDTVIDTTASVTNNAVDGFDLVEGAADNLGRPIAPIVRATTGFAEAAGVGQLGGDNLLTAVIEAPGTVLDGRPADAVNRIVGETQDTIGAARDAANQIVDAINPVASNLVGTAGNVLGTVGSGSLLDANLLDPDGNGPANTMLGAVLNPGSSGAILQLDGAGNGSPSQSGNVVDIALGPSDASQGGISLLNAGPGGNDGAATVNVLGAGSGLPPLVDADLATNPDTLNLGGIGGIGSLPGSGGMVDGLLGTDLTPSGTLLGADVAGNGTPSQSSNLIDTGVGPRDQQTAGVDVLSPAPGGNPGTAEANVLNVGPDGVKLLDADVATQEDTLNFAAVPAVVDSSVTDPILTDPVVVNGPSVDNTVSGTVSDVVHDVGVTATPTLPTTQTLDLHL